MWEMCPGEVIMCLMSDSYWVVALDPGCFSLLNRDWAFPQSTLKGSGLWFVYSGSLWEGEPVGLSRSTDKHLQDLGTRLWLKPHSTLHPCLPPCGLCGHDRGPCPSHARMPTVTSAPWLSPSTAPARSPRSPPGSSQTSAGPAGPWPHGAGQPQGLSSHSCHWQERWYPQSPGTCLGRGEQGCCWHGGLPPGRWNPGRH